MPENELKNLTERHEQLKNQLQNRQAEHTKIIAATRRLEDTICYLQGQLDLVNGLIQEASAPEPEFKASEIIEAGKTILNTEIKVPEKPIKSKDKPEAKDER